MQKTLSKPVKIQGVGLHSGLRVSVILKPAPPNTGIVFVRTDKNSRENIIQANFKNVVSAKLCTKIANSSGSSVSTIEHLMAAIYGEDIDNMIVEVNNLEIPIMDGSAAEFVRSIRSSGLKEQNIPRQFIKVLKKVEVENDSKYMSIEPLENDFKIDFELIYKNKLIGNQREIVSSGEGDLETIYKARTFCLYEDVERMKAKGLIKGGSLDNAIVVEENKILNVGGLRDKNEFVKHKILDCLGDFMLTGHRIFGSIKCVQGGHQLTNAMLLKFFSDSSNWELVYGKKDLKNKKDYNYNRPIAVNA